MATPSFYVNRILQELGITEPEDLKLLDLIAWQRGALVIEQPLKGAEARLTFVGVRAIITISSAVLDPRRKRFSIAHEIGHLEMHRRDGNLAFCTKEDIDSWEFHQAGTKKEQEANEFASALLLPEQLFAPRCQERDPSLEVIAELADRFEVSLTA